MSSWRPALRIARRITRRNIGRSLLVAILVGVPVAGATFADVLYRSTNGPEHDAYRDIGSADAQVLVTSANELYNGWFPSKWGDIDIEQLSDDRDPGAVDLAEYLPSGSFFVPNRQYRDARFAMGEGFIRTSANIASLGDPLTQHQARLDSGAWPEEPNEIVVTRSLAKRLRIVDGGDLVPDAELALFDGPTVRVTGLAINPFCLSCEEAMAMPGSALDVDQPEDEQAVDPYLMAVRSYLVDLPEDVEATDLVPQLADEGIAMVPREVYLQPDEVAAGMNLSMDDVQAIALGALIVGLGLLEIVLLAGAAFAVGARRQTRDLGLAAVNGATTKQVRRIVLAQGLTLGAIGAVLGVALGAVIIVVAEPLWERLFGQLIDHWRYGLGEIAIAAGVGVVSGLAAAVIPAVGAARMKPVDALAGRFRASKLAARMPLLGVVLIALGVATALMGNRVISGKFEEYQRALESAPPGAWVSQPDTSLAVTLQLLGATLAVAGIVIAIPALVTFLARVAGRFSFPLRYAMRDAARHRHRTAPTVAAIMIVVTGSVGLAFVIGGMERAEKAQFVPSMPDDVMAIRTTSWGPDSAETQALAAGKAAVKEKLPEADVADVTVPFFEVAPPDAQLEEEASSEFFPAFATPEPVAPCDDGDCMATRAQGEVAMVTPELFELITGRPMNTAEKSAVESGSAIVFDRRLVGDDNTVTVGAETYVYEDPFWDGWSKPDRAQLVAHVVAIDHRYSSFPLVLAPADAFPTNVALVTDRSFVAYGDASESDVSAAVTAAELQGVWTWIEDGPESYAGITALILAAASAFVTLVGVAIAVSLAAAESRADYATLGAVGAAPRRRRLIAGAQALVVGGVGTALGLALGAYIAFTAWPTTGSPDFVVPWSSVALTSIAVPTLAVVVAMIFTPSRLPMLRRLE